MTSKCNRTLAVLENARQIGQKLRPVWVGDDGLCRVGRSNDMIEMLEQLGHRTIA